MNRWSYDWLILLILAMVLAFIVVTGVRRSCTCVMCNCAGQR